MMFRYIVPVAVFLCAAPVAAQQTEPDEGLSLMERGAQMLMEGLLKELEPALEGLEDLGPSLREFAQSMGPALADLMAEIEDWSAYHPPEMLPNGDIIIRRRTPKDEVEDGDQIDI